MQIRQLEHFVEVCARGSISAAADHLHIVQSGVSSSIRALERELGTELFERRSRGVVVRDSGAALLPLARGILDAVREAEDAVREVERGLSGTIVIGAIPALGIVDLPAAIARFRRAHPGVTIQLKVGGSRSLATLLAQGEIDFALLSPVGAFPADFELRKLGESPFVVVYSDDTSFDAESPLTLEQVASLPFVDSPEGFGNRDLLDMQFGRYGLQRHVAVESPDAWSIPRLVALGAGVGLVPAFIAEATGEAVRWSTLIEPEMSWPLHLATSRLHGPSRAGRRFISEELSG
jgi:DNA-binding transcriptional LysR family regulator